MAIYICGQTNILTIYNIQLIAILNINFVRYCGTSLNAMTLYLRGTTTLNFQTDQVDAFPGFDINHRVTCPVLRKLYGIQLEDHFGSSIF